MYMYHRNREDNTTLAPLPMLVFTAVCDKNWSEIEAGNEAKYYTITSFARLHAYHHYWVDKISHKAITRYLTTHTQIQETT